MPLRAAGSGAGKQKIAGVSSALFIELGVFNDFVALVLLRRASELALDDASILANLAEVYFSLSRFRKAAITASRIDLRRAGPELRVVVAALAWAAACLTQAPERAQAQQLERAYAALSESTHINRSWKGTKHALTYGRYLSEESQPVIDVLNLLEKEVTDENRAQLRTLLAPPTRTRSASR